MLRKKVELFLNYIHLKIINLNTAACLKRLHHMQVFLLFRYFLTAAKTNCYWFTILFTSTFNKLKHIHTHYNIHRASFITINTILNLTNLFFSTLPISSRLFWLFYASSLNWTLMTTGNCSSTTFCFNYSFLKCPKI